MASRGIAGSVRCLSTAAAALQQKPLYLGLDSSTQGIKAIVMDDDLNTTFSTAINYGQFSQYKTNSGVHDHGNGVVTAPAAMIAHGLDAIMKKLVESKVDMSKIVAISGSGQQHGSVYWAKGARKLLAKLQPGQPLEPQLKAAFSLPDCPIWMDSSTSKQCAQLEEAVGGAQAMATLTGSRCYERFTANQILKRVQENKAAMDNTERVSLISSFLCSLLLGDYAPIDLSDGAGMNLLDLKTLNWSDKIASYIGSDIKTKLGTPVPAYQVVGTVNRAIASMYGLDSGCRIVPWSGDNPCSLAGLGLKTPGDIGVSLGTSDTLFSIIDKQHANPGLEGHFFPNPVDPDSYMSMLCYKNGSLSREKVASAVADGNWDKFNKMVAQDTAPGNNGYIGFYIDRPEIIPHISKTGVRRFDAAGKPLSGPFENPAVEARAVLEGQFMSMRLHSQTLGVRPNSITATGGASKNPVICQVLADVFGCPVKAAKTPDSAALGAAFRAKHAVACQAAGSFVPFATALGRDPAKEHRVVAQPNPKTKGVYDAMIERYKELEAGIVAQE